MTALANHQTGFAEVNGARLYYEVAGEGHPLVLLHAGVSDHHLWDDQFAIFAERYRVIRYDQRGFGQSAMPPGPFRLYEDLYGLLRFLGVDRVFLVGVSIGGGAVIDFTLAHPDMAAALIPVAAGLSGKKPSDATAQLFAPLQAAYEARDLDRILTVEMDIWLAGPGRALDSIDPALRARFVAMERPNLERELAGEDGTQESLDPPAAGRLGEIRVPTLVIVGDQDVPDVLDTADRLETGIAGARQFILPNVAHMVPMEAPEEFTRLVLHFLAALPSPA